MIFLILRKEYKEMAGSAPSIVGVIADTHDQVHHLVKVIDYFNREQVGLVIHCGDWVSPFTLKFYTKLQAPLFGVFGNNDGDKFRHLIYAEKYGLKVVFEDQLLVLCKYGKRIAVYHGDYQEIVDALVKCGDYDVVLHGHNHKAMVEKVGKVVSLNPGTLMDFTNKNVQGASFGLYNASIHEGRIVWVRNL
jgi:putative phosphoesterase